MSNDTELFELCSSVYVKTGWADESIWNMGDTLTPLYNSDYLLEKLPTKTRVEKHHIIGHPDKRKHLPDYDVYNAYRHTATAQHWVQSDTPLKALLKLTLALDEAGIELKEPSDV